MIEAHRRRNTPDSIGSQSFGGETEAGENLIYDFDWQRLGGPKGKQRFGLSCPILAAVGHDPYVMHLHRGQVEVSFAVW